MPIVFRSQFITLAPQLQSNILPPTPISCPSTHTFSLQSVGFPNPYPGQFIIYLLQFCPAQTSTCFSCSNPFKQTDGIPAPPSDLVVVQECFVNGLSKAKHEVNLVIFTSIAIQIASDVNNESSSQVALSCINPTIQAHLQLLHYCHLQETFGM